jgi:hypothetical protein
VKEYLFHWQFWAATILVALAVNWFWNKYVAKGSGQLV